MRSGRCEQKAATKDKPEANWKTLFDGKSLTGWKSTPFGGEGKVYVKDGAIRMEIGGDLTGVTWTGKPPRSNYEISLEGMRIDGADFFCTTTFPVGQEYCSLVVGGWGGSIVGLSSIDSCDASENATTKVCEFPEQTVVSCADSRRRRQNRGLDRQPTDRRSIAGRQEVQPPQRS